MEFDFKHATLALSYALDCVEHDLLGVTTNHGKRVGALALLLSQQLCLTMDLEQKQLLCACAVMHDCALSEYVQDEYNGSFQAAVKKLPDELGPHCRMGEETMRLMPFPYEKIQNVVLYHHECADGSGPMGLTSEKIPQAARLIQIADTVDATHDLSWLDRDKLAQLDGYLRRERGVLFPPAECDAFLALLRDPVLEQLRNEKIDLFLGRILPGGAIPCSPATLERFAGVFARIVDYKSEFTKDHSVGIAEKAKAMGQYYGADEETCAKLYFAGALHDIGKLVVDRDVLEKPDKLSGEEYRHIQTHAYYTYKILSDIPGLEDITRWASRHHEKLDGSGYPFGLKADQLGKWDRLMCCLDIYQALTESRPYKKAMTHDRAMEILREMAGAGQLDRDIVEDVHRCCHP